MLTDFLFLRDGRPIALLSPPRLVYACSHVLRQAGVGHGMRCATPDQVSRRHPPGRCLRRRRGHGPTRYISSLLFSRVAAPTLNNASRARLLCCIVADTHYFVVVAAMPRSFLFSRLLFSHFLLSAFLVSPVSPIFRAPVAIPAFHI